MPLASSHPSRYLLWVSETMQIIRSEPSTMIPPWNENHLVRKLQMMLTFLTKVSHPLQNNDLVTAETLWGCTVSDMIWWWLSNITLAALRPAPPYTLSYDFFELEKIIAKSLYRDTIFNYTYIYVLIIHLFGFQKLDLFIMSLTVPGWHSRGNFA